MSENLLVVGLGNPGPQYSGNRHNFGFMVADELIAQAPGAGWREKFSGQLATLRMGDTAATLLKPLTFMNLSGAAVARAAAYFDFDPKRIVVIHDELDLEFGTVRVKNGGGTAGHKGIASIKAALGDSGFVRIRMGIGRPLRGSATDYVLKDFSPDEKISLDDIVKRGADAVNLVAREGVSAAMNEINRRA